MEEKFRILVNLIETYSVHKNIHQKEVVQLFEETGASNYILKFAEIFGSSTDEYNMDDLDEFISNRIDNEGAGLKW